MKREDWRRAYEPLPESLAVRVAHTLSQLEEERVVKKHVFRTVVIVCALALLLGGTALAVARQYGVGDFLDWMYGERMNSGARQLVEYPQASKRVGDATVTVREAVWDGFVGHLVIEYRSPEGTAMVPWDDRRLEGKAETEEELLAQYGAFYCPVDPGMSFLTEEGAQEIGEMSFMYYQEADNVLSMILTFGEEELKSSELRFKAGVFKFDQEVEGEKEKQFIDFELADYTSENRTFTFDHPGDLNGKVIDRVVFTFTPMQTVVDIDYADGSRTYTGMDVLVLDEAGNVVNPTSTSLWTNGVDAFEKLPRKLCLQAATNGEPVGEPLALTFE